jgi:hypothetical protein
MQSLEIEHFLPGVHPAHQSPPQSTSLSWPSILWSMHVSKTQVLDRASQAPLWQSALLRQRCFSAQPAQKGPPQSTSDSRPSWR